MSDHGNKLVLAIEKCKQLQAQLEDQRSDLTEAISKKAEECQQLKAQVERLREFAVEVRDEFPCDSDSVDALIKETTAQSLLLHDADVLEEFAKALPEVASNCAEDHQYGMDAMDCSEWMIQEANALRQQAKEKS